MNFGEKTLLIEEATTRDSNPAALTGDTESSQHRVAASKPLQKGKVFNLSYDKLVVAVGCYSQTFGTPGVRENAFFLKDVGDARKIRERILQCERPYRHPSHVPY